MGGLKMHRDGRQMKAAEGGGCNLEGTRPKISKTAKKSSGKRGESGNVREDQVEETQVTKGLRKSSRSKMEFLPPRLDCVSSVCQSKRTSGRESIHVSKDIVVSAHSIPARRSSKPSDNTSTAQAKGHAPPPSSAALPWDERMLNWLLKNGGMMAAFLHLHFKQVLSCVLIAFMCVLWACKYFYLLSSDSIKSSMAVHLSLAVQLLIDIKDVSKQCVAKTLQSPKASAQDKQAPKDKEIVVETWTDLWHYLLDCHFRAWAVVSNALDYIAIRSMMAAGGLCMILVLPFALLFAFAALLLWYYRCIMFRIAWTEKRIEAMLFKLRMKCVDAEMAVEEWMMPFLGALRFYRRSFFEQLEQRASVLRELVGPELGFTLALFASVLWTVDAFMADAHLENGQEEDYEKHPLFFSDNAWRPDGGFLLADDEAQLIAAISESPRQGFYLGPHSCPPSPRLLRPAHRQRRECLYVRGGAAKKADVQRSDEVDALPSFVRTSSVPNVNLYPADQCDRVLGRLDSIGHDDRTRDLVACSSSALRRSTNGRQGSKKVAFVDISCRSFQDSITGSARVESRSRGGILKRRDTGTSVSRLDMSELVQDEAGLSQAFESSRNEKGFASAGRIRETGSGRRDEDGSSSIRCLAPEKRRPSETSRIANGNGISTSIPITRARSTERSDSDRQRRMHAAKSSGSEKSPWNLKGKGNGKGNEEDDGVGGTEGRMKRLYTYPK